MASPNGSNNAQYPAASVQTKIFPTCPLGIVSKFDPATKYREEEEIYGESGALTVLVGVDNMNEVDVEVVMYPNQSVPAPLSTVVFSGSNSGSYLIRGDVKTTGAAGKSKRIAFKAFNNSSLP